ncbi:hypothetical protein VZT92_012019 [Zoarces viviparus]|uniref:Uncharacterized protein n=1 Tax=Zoarces viviparus TaxID=48416 RepID=A0AAW1F849_ZOAVI
MSSCRDRGFYSLSNRAHTLGTRDKMMVSVSFPAAARAPPPMYAPKPVAPHLPLFTSLGLTEDGCGGVGSSREREGEREAALLLEDGCSALAVQAGGIEGDRDQSPSAPSLRVPRPPNYKSMF